MDAREHRPKRGPVGRAAAGLRHCPVLLEEVVAAVLTDDAGVYVDGTFGRGGHSRALLQGLSAAGRIIALDQDPEAVAAGAASAAADPRLELVHASFESLAETISARGLSGRVRGVMLDLGVSSPQLEDARRGFSFRRDGPLDMRMNPRRGEPVAAWLNRASGQEISRVLRRLGEERHAARIARAVERARAAAPIERTAELGRIVTEAYPERDRRQPGKHPATRTFQALRIFINRELEALEKALPQALDVLAPGGRLAVISFHSLEDRMVKRFFRERSRAPNAELDLPVPNAREAGEVRLVGRARRPRPAETERNPRARSAVLRVAEKRPAPGAGGDFNTGDAR